MDTRTPHARRQAHGPTMHACAPPCTGACAHEGWRDCQDSWRCRADRSAAWPHLGLQEPIQLADSLVQGSASSPAPGLVLLQAGLVGDGVSNACTLDYGAQGAGIGAARTLCCCAHLDAGAGRLGRRGERAWVEAARCPAMLHASPCASQGGQLVFIARQEAGSLLCAATRVAAARGRREHTPRHAFVRVTSSSSSCLCASTQVPA